MLKSQCAARAATVSPATPLDGWTERYERELSDLNLKNSPNLTKLTISGYSSRKIPVSQDKSG